jgi:hypothetical protein
MSSIKYSFGIAINKKWLENQSDLKETEYESPTLVYCREINAMVPLMSSRPLNSTYNARILK